MKKAIRESDAINCWQFWDCSEEAKLKCPVYKSKDGRRCWTYTHDLLIPFHFSRQRKKFKSCEECPWYKKMQKLTPEGDLKKKKRKPHQS